MRLSILALASTAVAAAVQAPFTPPSFKGSHPNVPRVQYDDAAKEPPKDMEVFEVAVSGKVAERVNLAFFADGYKHDEKHKFKNDVEHLADAINGMADISELVNVWGVFVPSNESGVGIDKPLDTPFGLYRPGNELRAVFTAHPGVGKAACAALKECDQPVLVGNDGLYGGLGGTFTIITASALNGPIVLRHELGHSLIPVGEEYDGGFVYDGVNADSVDNVGKLKWRDHLTSPERVRIEDSNVAVQAYPWHDLDDESYSIAFEGSNKPFKKQRYVRSLLRVSLSSIPHPSHIVIALNGDLVDLEEAFPKDWEGNLDRRWLEVPLDAIPAGPNLLEVELSGLGRKAKAGQGGKMVTSVEIIEYAKNFNAEEGFIGAFKTFAEDGGVTLRPTNEGCLMRRVNHPTLCRVCEDGLVKSLKDKIKKKNV